MRKLVGAAVILLGLTGIAWTEGIGWFMENGYAYYNGGVTMLAGSTDSNLGCFVQLLWVGPNGTPDAAYAYGDGTGLSDDVVIGWRWIGGGAADGGDGWFSGGEYWAGGNVVSGRVYFSRFWTAPTPNYVSGLVPTSLTNYYANGPTWTYPHWNPIVDDFDAAYAGNIVLNQTPLAIPEPAAVGLVLVGLGCVRMMRRRQAA